MVVVSVEVGVLVAVEVGVGPSFSSPALCFCSSVLFEPPDTHFPETILDPTFVITDPKI